VATWLTRTPEAIASAVVTVHFDTLCALGNSLHRHGRVDVLDRPRRLLVSRCRRDRRYRGEDSAVMVAAAGIVLGSTDLTRTSPEMIEVLAAMTHIALMYRAADADLARLLADGLLRHIEVQQFLASANGRAVWLLALALRAPTVDPTVTELALQLLERDAAHPERADREALATELAARWREDGEFLRLNGDLWLVGDVAWPPLILTDTWAKFVGSPDLVGWEDQVAPAWWRALSPAERTRLAAESQRRRYENQSWWIGWLREQEQQLGLTPSATVPTSGEPARP
jgi:hypothetical protein